MAPTLVLGAEVADRKDLKNALVETLDQGFDYIVVPLSDPDRRAALNEKGGDFFALCPDTELNATEWSQRVVGVINPIASMQSFVIDDRYAQEDMIEREFMWASHLSICAVMVNISNLSSIPVARAIAKCLKGGSSFRIWARVPMATDSEDPWDWWNLVRTISDQSPFLHLALEMGSALPTDSALERWMGEPVRAIVVQTSCFLTNKSGYPCLSRSHQTLLHKFFDRNVDVVLSGPNFHPAINKEVDLPGLFVYQRYINHLHETSPQQGDASALELSYRDVLQMPLQPLKDNLESQTYETFEKDPVKYAQYQKAVELALIDRSGQIDSAGRQTIMVLGAGRGPLVRACLAAADATGVNVFIYAVEKNINAVVTLKFAERSEWLERVTVVSSDMRDFRPSEKADIIVSELLGSFGDNELSPECLDGADFLLKENGISIPCEYTSYLQPICSQKLYSEARSLKKTGGLEVPYVVKISNADFLGQYKKCFTFKHPNRNPVSRNRRACTLEWKVSKSSVVHGFAGVFESVLYGDVIISIHPETFSEGMFSWFSIYFPILNPIAVKENEVVKLDMWRCDNSKSVWYEWVVGSPVVSALHNVNGEKYTIGL